MLDPELAAASVLIERPDLTDVPGARALEQEVRETTSSASEDTWGRVSFIDRQIPASAPNTLMTVRIYSPVDSAIIHPGVLYFHGGAFVIGDLESEHPRCLRWAADAGCVVVSVEYRLAPEFPFPTGAEDCYSALEWLHDSAAELGVDPERIAVAGNSAGGGLAAATALMARDRGGPPLAMQMLLCPVLDDRMETDSMKTFTDSPVLDNRNTAAMWSQYLQGTPASEYAAPSRTQHLEGLPAAYVLAAEIDPLRDEAIFYALRLLRAGVSVELQVTAGTYHGFDQLVADAAISRRAIDDQIHHLKRFLRV